MMNRNKIDNTVIFQEIKSFIEESKQQLAVAVNSTMAMLYWKIGKRVNQEILQEKRAEYGKQIVATLWRQLSFSLYGLGMGVYNCA